MTLLIFLLIFALLDAPISMQAESFTGILSGPEKSGEQHQYLVDVKPGTFLVMNVSFKSLEGVGARIYAAIVSPIGGSYAYLDDVLPASSIRNMSLSYYFGSSMMNEKVGLVVGSVADRYAPAVVEYSIKAQRIELLDMGLSEAGDTIEKPLIIDLRENWNASLSSVFVTSIAGYLSSGGQGNDHEDHYLVLLPVEADYIVETFRDRPLIDVYVRLRDGYTVSEPRNDVIYASLRSTNEFLLSIETNRPSPALINYNLTLKISRIVRDEEKEVQWAWIDMNIAIATMLALIIALIILLVAGPGIPRHRRPTRRHTLSLSHNPAR